MNRLPPTQPAKATVPSCAATNELPNGAPMSIPRCPVPYGSCGGSNPLSTGPTTGHAYVPYAGSALAIPAGRSRQKRTTTAIAAAVIRPDVIFHHPRRPEGQRQEVIEGATPCL